MSEMFTPETLSNESLKAAFDAAMMDTSIDADGDLVVDDQYHALVTVHPSDYIRFMSVFRFREESDPVKRLELVNRINDKLIIARASVHNDLTLMIDWYLPAKGRISKKTVVLALRKFEDIISSISQKDEDDIID